MYFHTVHTKKLQYWGKSITMLILLTLSFLPTDNRTSNMSDVIRNVSHLISKKQFALPPQVTEPRLRNSEPPEEDSAEIYRNTHDVRVVDHAPGVKTDLYFSYNNTAMRLASGGGPQSDGSVSNMVLSPPVPIAKNGFNQLSLSRLGLKKKRDGPIINTLINDQGQNLISPPLELKAQRLNIPPVLASSSLAPGDILNGDVMFTQRPKKDPYIQGLINEMQSRNTGYLSMAFEEMCEILSFKKPEYVRSVAQHTESVIDEMSYKFGRFYWLEEPMSTILRDVALVVSAEPTDEMQARTIILKALMQDRRSIIGEDVNEVFELADDLINRENGEHLFEVIHELKKFPNGTKTEKQLCQDIIQAFENPFYNQGGSRPLKSMVKKANQAFIDRFPKYSDLRAGKVPAPTPENVTSHSIHSHSKTKRPHKHRQKKPIKKTHRKTQGNTQEITQANTQEISTKSPQKTHTRQRNIKPIRPDALIG